MEKRYKLNWMNLFVPIGAHNSLLDLEELTEEQLNQIKERYEKLARIARKELSQGAADTKSVEV